MAKEEIKRIKVEPLQNVWHITSKSLDGMNFFPYVNKLPKLTQEEWEKVYSDIEKIWGNHQTSAKAPGLYVFREMYFELLKNGKW